MTDGEHPALKFVEALKDFAEGRTEADDWFAWWRKYTGELQAALAPGWYMKLKPRGEGMSAISGCHSGACYVLDHLGVVYQQSDRYQAARKEEFERYVAEEKSRQEVRAIRYAPILGAVSGEFPKFGRFLKKSQDKIDAIEEGIAQADLDKLERQVGPLPSVYKRFLQCVRVLELNGLYFSSMHPFRHGGASSGLPMAEMLCFADYWLEADGDQVLFDLRDGCSDDPPVLYYTHERSTPGSRRIATSFTAWIESLPRSPVFH